MITFYLSLVETEDAKNKIEFIYVNYYSFMCYTAGQILKHNKQDVEDAVHNAMMKIIENIDIIDVSDVQRAKNLCGIIARNKAIDYCKQKDNVMVGRWQVLEFSITNHEEGMTEYTSEGWWEFKSDGRCRGEFPQFPRLGIIDAKYDLDGNELTINWYDGEDLAVIKVFINTTSTGRLTFSGTINIYDRGVLANKIPISTSGKLKRMN